MRQYAKKPEKTSFTLSRKPRVSRQSSISEILQTYKNGTLGRQPLQSQNVKSEDLMQAKTWGQTKDQSIQMKKNSSPVIQLMRIYGTDGSKDTIVEEIKGAFGLGYRRFDCAFTYNKPAHGTIFDGLTPAERAEVQIIYKYKHENYEAMQSEIKQYFSMGIKIASIMLHELPDNIEEGLERLLNICEELSAKIGISNIDDFTLSKIVLPYFKKKGSKLDYIENKVNLLNQDKDVRTIASKENIEYLGYGLAGSTPQGGTCSLTNDSVKGEIHNLLYDPLLKKMSDFYQMTVSQLLFSWADRSQINSISRSSNKARQAENLQFKPFPMELLEIMNKFADKTYINYYLEKTYSPGHINLLKTMFGEDSLIAYYKLSCCVLEYNLGNHQIILDSLGWINFKIVDKIGDIGKHMIDLCYLKINKGYNLSLYLPKNNFPTETLGLVFTQKKRFNIYDNEYQEPCSPEEAEKAKEIVIHDKVTGEVYGYTFDEKYWEPHRVD